MIRWIPYTFVRTVLFFMGGIVLGLYFPDVISEQTAGWMVAVLVISYFTIVFCGRRFRRALNPGAIALFLVMLLGYVHVRQQTESRNPEHLLHHGEPISYYQAIVTRFAEEKARSWKMEAEVQRVYSNGWQEKKGKIILYFSKTDFPGAFQYGDVLLIRGQPQVPEGPSNPEEFDYRAYLALKNTYHQHFLRAGSALKVSHAPPSQVLAFAFRGRAWAESTLKKFVHGPQEQAIASALVLGVTDGLDNELLTAYAATGAMHILAVSGLHVSILYFILLRILKPANRLPAGRWVVALVALSVLWLYAFVTGLSPSVLRAVTMFSFLAIARPWARSTNIYNTLAVSAFCLLLFDPFLLRAVGFQLSYLAVLGIVYLYPRILVLWEPSHRFTTEIWKVTAVSLAAQIATFPLGLLYFHQFPNYFLLSNLVVVPLSSVVLILGLLTLGMGFIAFAGSAIGFCLERVIMLLNGIVFTLEDIPFSQTENIYLTTAQCALLIAFIGMMLTLTHFRKFRYLVYSFATVILFAALQWAHVSRDVNIRKITVYKIPGHTGVDLIDRGQVFFLSDSQLPADLLKLRYHVAPNRLKAGVKVVHQEVPVAHDLKGGRLVAWGGKKILMVTEDDFMLPGPLVVDWIIIGNNAMDVQRITGGITCQKIILDSSNSFFFASRFLEAAKLYKLDVHSVLHHGAFDSKIENQDT